MTTLILRKKKWVVKDKGNEWVFDTHAEAQQKVDELMKQKLLEISHK